MKIKLSNVEIFLCDNEFRFFTNDKPITSKPIQSEKIPFLCTPDERNFDKQPTNNLFYIIAHGGKELTPSQRIDFVMLYAGLIQNDNNIEQMKNLIHAKEENLIELEKVFNSKSSNEQIQELKQKFWSQNELQQI